MGYGANVTVADILQNTPLHYLLAKKNAQPLSDWTPHLNEVNGSMSKTPLHLFCHTHLKMLQVHEYVSSADNSIQDVPVYITVACFLVSEGASLDIPSSEGVHVTPRYLCPPEYHPLLQLFAQPKR